MSVKAIRISAILGNLAAWAAIILLVACGGTGSGSTTAAAVAASTPAGTGNTAGTPTPVATAQTLPNGFYLTSGKYFAVLAPALAGDLLGTQTWSTAAGFQGEGAYVIGGPTPGQYTGKVDGSPVTLTVDSTGQVSGEALDGCALIGFVSQDAAHTFSGSYSCVGGTLTGLGALIGIPSGTGMLTEFIIAADGPSDIVFTGMAATPPPVTPPPVAPPPVTPPPVAPPPDPAVFTFSSDALSVVSGASATLTWSTNAVCVPSWGAIIPAGNGSYSTGALFQNPSNFSLTCGVATQTISIIVTQPVYPLPVSLLFSAPGAVSATDRVTFTWVSPASACDLYGTTNPFSTDTSWPLQSGEQYSNAAGAGTVTVSPLGIPGVWTFELDCTDGESATAQVSAS